MFYVVLGSIGALVFSHTYEAYHVGDFIKELSNQTVSVAHAAAPGDIIDSINGEVIAVSDGDTLTVRSSYGDLIIRLFAIDAPEAKCHGFSDGVCVESGQPDATASKLYLRDLTLHKQVNVRLGQGMSGKRLVGTVLAEGKDVNLEMVRAGHAWHYKFFSKNQTADEKKAYTMAENNAKSLRSGLWADNNPTPPWMWRKLNKIN